MSKVGKRVLYMCTEEDAQYVGTLREEGAAVNPLESGNVLPGVIVADWSNGEPDGCFNVSVTLDGNIEPMWKTSIFEGAAEGKFMFIE